MSYRLADSVSEMMHMREEGMPNKVIAHRFGCAVSTVYRIIGKQPEEIRIKRASKPIPTPENPKHKSFRQWCEEAKPLADRVEMVENTVRTKQDLQKRMNELTLLFGVEAVKGYLRCVGYQAGTSIGMPVLTCEECLEALKGLEGEHHG